MVGALACSHNPAPQTAHATPATMPMQTALIATPEPANPQLAPGAPPIPKDAQVTPPRAPLSPPADESPVTTSSNLASPRPSSAPPVAIDPTRDAPQTSADVESVREIRALLAADKSLSSTARQVTIFAQNGRVRLTGQVNTAEERAAIERAARRAANVTDVKNQLVVLE
jgi:hypothetical protein